MATIEVVPLGKIKPNPQNPRVIKDDKYHKLVQSIKDFPEMLEAREIVVNMDYMILGGNQRYKACGDAGVKEVPVKKVDWSPEKQQEFVAKDNISYGDWDWSAAADQWDQETLENWGLDTPEEWPTDEDDEDDPDDDAPDIDAKNPAQSELGKVYQLGPHRLMCGDSTNKSHVAKLMQGHKADMVLTDPPYNIDYEGNMKQRMEGKLRSKISNDKMDDKQFADFLEKVCTNLVKNCKGGIYIFMSPKEIGTLKKAFEKSGGHWHNTIIWVKNHFTMSGGDYKNIYEPIIYGWPQGVKRHYFGGDGSSSNVWEAFGKQHNVRYNEEYTTLTLGPFKIRIKGQIESGEVQNTDDLKDIWRFKRPSKSKEHPTMKPVKLCTEAIMNSSLRNQIVLDLFGGSGSTLIAADSSGRVCYTMEYDPQYCDVIRKRYAKHVEPDVWEEEWLELTPEIQDGV